MAVHGRFRVQAGLPQHPWGQLPVQVHHLAEPVQGHERNPQHLPHVPQRRAHPVADLVGHHGRPVPAVLPVHPLDHLFPAVVLDVEVDVGWLRPLPRQEPFEQEGHAHGVHRGDPEAVAHRGVGRGPSALAQDALLPAEGHHVVHREEVADVVQLLDQGQLPLQLVRHLRRHAPAVPTPGAFEGQGPQPLSGGVALRQPLGRVAVAQRPQGEGAALRHLQGPADSPGVVREQGCEGFRGLQGVLRVGPDALPGFCQGNPVPHAGQHVLQGLSGGCVIQDLAAGHHREAVAGRELAGARLQGRVGEPTVAGDEEVQAVCERVAQCPGHRTGVVRRCETASLPTPQGHQPLGVLDHLFPRDLAAALLGAQVTAGEQPAQVPVPFAVLDQEDHVGPVTHGHLGTHHQVHPDLLRGQQGLHHAVHPVPVREGQGREAQGVRGAHELFRVACALQEGVVALAPQGRVHYSTRPCRNHLCLRWS
ncbi:hypothetical protein HRbin32_01387 [bacterium HR32]|nr:hypothetical protein HRbin32_01387 [bacterium HR32]